MNHVTTKNWRAAVPPFWGLDPHLTQCRLAEAYLRTRWHLGPSSRLATIDMGRKVGELLCPFRGGCWVPIRQT